MFPSFRPVDLLILFVIALLVFGPKRLPEMGKAIGTTFKEFKKSVSDIQESSVTPPATLPPQNMTAASVTPVHEPVE